MSCTLSSPGTALKLCCLDSCRFCFLRLLSIYISFTLIAAFVRWHVANKCSPIISKLSSDPLHSQHLQRNRTCSCFWWYCINDNCLHFHWNLWTTHIIMIISTLCKIDRTSWRSTCHLQDNKEKIACGWKEGEQALICRVVAALLKSNSISLYYTVHMWSSCSPLWYGTWLWLQDQVNWRLTMNCFSCPFFSRNTEKFTLF